MTATVTIKDFLARQADLDGPVEHESGLGDDDFVMETDRFYHRNRRRWARRFTRICAAGISNTLASARWR